MENGVELSQAVRAKSSLTMTKVSYPPIDNIVLHRRRYFGKLWELGNLGGTWEPGNLGTWEPGELGELFCGTWGTWGTWGTFLWNLGNLGNLGNLRSLELIENQFALEFILLWYWGSGELGNLGTWELFRKPGRTRQQRARCDAWPSAVAASPISAAGRHRGCGHT